jgi:hypothetical protein
LGKDARKWLATAHGDCLLTDNRRLNEAADAGAAIAISMIAVLILVSLSSFFGFSRTPGPPPFSAINSTPAFSSAPQSAAIVDCFASDPFSILGIAPLREQCERAADAERRAAMRMARTKPATPAGAAALIAYTRRDIMAGKVDWQMVALKTVASALARMTPQKTIALAS